MDSLGRCWTGVWIPLVLVFDLGVPACYEIGAWYSYQRQLRIVPLSRFRVRFEASSLSLFRSLLTVVFRASFTAATVGPQVHAPAEKSVGAFTYPPSTAIIQQALSPSHGNKANAETIERYVKQRS